MDVLAGSSLSIGGLVKLSKLESLLAEAKKDPAITGDSDVQIRVGSAQADDILLAVREAITHVVGDGIPKIGGLPGSIASHDPADAAPAAVVSSEPPIYRQPKMIVLEGK
jgi:hypothetical protein